MGVAYNGLGKYQEAIDVYKEAIKIKSDYYEAYYNMGVAS
jgi:tetratricopeptide (TPR) repeat protein